MPRRDRGFWRKPKWLKSLIKSQDDTVTALGGASDGGETSDNSKLLLVSSSVCHPSHLVRQQA
jgi:hypothetical protein